MKIFDTCVQVRLVKWQCNRTVRLIERFGIAPVLRGLVLITGISAIAAAALAIGLMNWLFRYVSSINPDMSVWAMLVCLVLAVVGCWAWSSAWGLGVLHYATRDEWVKANNDPKAQVVFCPRCVWQFRLLNILLDPAGMSAMRQQALNHSTTATPPEAAPPQYPSRF